MGMNNLTEETTSEAEEGYVNFSKIEADQGADSVG